MPDPTVQISQGELVGTIEQTPNGPVHRFAGIPFAASPTRFAAPQPGPSWDGPRSAAEFGPSPVQTLEGPFSGTVPGMTPDRVSEDCLTLNVWRPANGGDNLPVLLWIYGGAFTIGSGSLESYDGARFAAEQNVVIVTVNYRIGAFGFLDLRDYGGDEIGAVTNAGLRDQLFAAQWVKENIAAFGGDSSRITVFGESAGAGSIIHLISAPGAKDAIARAIPQSPGVDFTQTPEVAGIIAGRLLAEIGVRTASELVEVPADRLLAAQEAVMMNSMAEYGAMIFHPVIDDDVVFTTPSIALARGDAAGIDLLIGSTADEMRLYPDPRANALGRDGLIDWTTQYLTNRMGGKTPPPDRSAALVDNYAKLGEGTNRSAGADQWAALTTDGGMRLPALRLADSHSAHNPRTYAYAFTWQSQNPNADLGAFHSIDIPFTFDTFDRAGWGEFVGIDDAGRAVGHALRSAWAAFAATGDPTSAVYGPWPAYETGHRTMKILGTPLEIVDDPLGTLRDWWDGLWDETARPPGFPV
ncbi:carboxylesterase family protein [Dactylosporangium sp. NPDC051485]|uniref:carboxylesterase/lipase family protein n=1 Tax=Dactylosporangium sp. NPDC051485 TaxID=3154846 RepID=UPI00343BBBE8